MNHEMLQSLLLSSRAPRTSRKGRGEEMPWLVQLLPCYSPPRKRSRFSRPVCPGLRPCRSGSQSGQVPWPRARCPPRAWHRHARGSVPGHGRGSCRVLSLRNCAALCSAGERRQQWKRCPIPGGGGALRESSAGRAGPCLGDPRSPVPREIADKSLRLLWSPASKLCAPGHSQIPLGSSPARALGAAPPGQR